MNEKRQFGWIVILIGLLAASPANAQFSCQPFPTVPWWQNINHQSVTEYVGKNFGGNWQRYIAQWEYQLKRLREIEGKGSAAVVTDEKIRLQGASLRKYVVLVEKRLTVMRCLAGQARRPSAPMASAKSTIAAPVPTVPGTGQAIAAAKGCSNCHGTKGIATHATIPNLAGQSAFYLVKQIKEFQAATPASGAKVGANERHDKIMQKQVGGLSDEDVWNLASYFSGLPSCPAGSTLPVSVSQPKSAATCIECHGPKGRPIFPDVPVIAGQKQAYLETQMRQYRSSAGGVSQGPNWASRYHYFMSAIAKSLSNREIFDLARWFSRQACG